MTVKSPTRRTVCKGSRSNHGPAFRSQRLSNWCFPCRRTKASPSPHLTTRGPLYRLNSASLITPIDQRFFTYLPRSEFFILTSASAKTDLVRRLFHCINSSQTVFAGSRHRFGPAANEYFAEGLVVQHYTANRLACVHQFEAFVDVF